MAIRYLLDTNIFIYIRQRRPPGVLARFEALQAGVTGMSVVSYGELQYGAERSRNPGTAFKALEEFAELIQVLPLPASAGRTYAQIRRSLEIGGQIIGANDLWIAAHARAAELTLVTNNEREFKRVAGLKIENWTK